MPKPTFYITTTDDSYYLHGRTTAAFKDLGVDSAQLESYEHEGDFVVLKYTAGLHLLIPESQIQHIAELDGLA